MAATGDKLDLSVKTVVYATDFSHCSENAGAFAARLAAHFSAQLLVAHAFSLSQAALEVEVETGEASEQRRDLISLLTAKAARLSTDGIVAVPTLVEGDPRDAISALADRNAPSLIALGTQGRGWLERGIIGSAAERILRSTQWPCLTVSPHVRPPSADTFPFKRILFATDFSEAAARAAAYAVYFSGAMNAEIDVLNVIQDDDIENPQRVAELRNRFFKALDDLVPEQAKQFCDPRTFVAVGSAHDQILNHIRGRSIHLLVLGLRKTSHPSMEMRMSGAFRIIADAACPVLTIRS